MWYLSFWSIWLGCTQAPEVSAPPAKALPDVVFITLDTTRADRLGVYGYGQAHTETIDKLARDGRFYAHAYSAIPLTIPSHASIFTGDYPPHLGIRDNGDATVPDNAVMLAERLHDAGYSTAASVAAFVTTRTWGFDQGFDAYFDEIPKSDQNFWHQSRPGAAVVDDAISWWKNADPAKPKFLWVHLYDAHFPYTPDSHYAALTDGRPYDAEIAYLDDQVQRLVDATAAQPTLFVLVADHGESLGDHGELTHGLYVYDSTQHVPFILSGPGVVPGEKVDTPVSLVDVTPTLLATLGLDVPNDIDGRAQPAEKRPIYMETYGLRDRFGLSPHVGIVDGSDKYIDVTRPERYDLQADPQELTDIAGSDSVRLAELHADLTAFGYTGPTEGGATDPEIAAKLLALGYADGDFSGDVTGPLADPKDHRSLVSRSQRAERLDSEMKYTESEAIYRELITEYPNVNEFGNRLATCLSRQGRDEDALDVINVIVARNPDNAVYKSTQAGLLGRLGRHDDAARIFEEVAAALPYNPDMRTQAVMALVAGGHLEPALTLGQRYLEEHPDEPGVSGLVGIIYVRMDQPERAIPFLDKGLLAEKPSINVALRRAMIARKAGNTSEFERLVGVEAGAHPENRTNGPMYITILSDAKRWQDLATFGERAALARPDEVLFWHAWAQALFNLERYGDARVALTQGLKRFPESSLLLLLDANLLKKEGRIEDAAARFEAAKRAHVKEKLKAPTADGP